MAVMALLGWIRGAITLGKAFVALLAASILAVPFSILGKPVVKNFGVPELLAPTAATLLAGVFLFLVLLGVFSIYLRKKQGDQNPPQWDKPVGAVLGAVWGLCLVLFVFTGLNSIARADRAMREAAAVNQLRTEHRLKVEKEVRAELAPDRSLYAPEEFDRRARVAVARKMKSYKPKPEVVDERVEPGTLDPFLDQLRSFPLETTIDHFSAIDAKSEELFRDLTIVVGDPILFDQFQRNKTVQVLTQDPTIQFLGNDPEIAKAIRDKRFRELLDHPKIVEAARSDSLRLKFKEVDIEKILKETLGK